LPPTDIIMDSTLDRVEEEYGEEAQNEFEEEDDLISESELNIIKKFQETEDNSKPANEYNNLSDDNERAYQNPLCKPDYLESKWMRMVN